VYQAPRTYAYQWSRDGQPIAGATASTLTATSAGEYTCTVTAANAEGSGAQAGAKPAVAAATLKLIAKPKVRAKRGKFATFRIEAVNQSDLESGAIRVCVKLLGPARKVLKAPKCKQLGLLAGGGTKATALKLKVKPAAAPHTYRLQLLVRGASTRAIPAKVVVRS
jgi:hypothetical protein